jgi:FixJ family two-component response regulator
MSGSPIGTLGEIFIVDDDPAVRETLSIIFTSAGFEVVRFSEGASFLAATKERSPVCILLDVNIPGKTGLDILKQLNAQDYAAPIFIMSGAGDIPMAVEAIKNGALDFIQKPFKGSEVLQRVRDAIDATRRQQPTSRAQKQPLNFPGREPLSSREQDVLQHLLSAASSKEIARSLGISARTIEVHRARIMEKLGAKNTADLIRIALTEGHRR